VSARTFKRGAARQYFHQAPKRQAEAPAVLTEEQALAADRALNVLKRSQNYFELSDRFALDEQNGRAS